MQLDGVSRPMPQGKVLGGGSILNAMCWNRGGQDDYDAWEYLGNPGWGWNGMLPYFMKVKRRTLLWTVLTILYYRARHILQLTPKKLPENTKSVTNQAYMAIQVQSMSATQSTSIHNPVGPP